MTAAIIINLANNLISDVTPLQNLNNLRATLVAVATRYPTLARL